MHHLKREGLLGKGWLPWGELFYMKASINCRMGSHDAQNNSPKLRLHSISRSFLYVLWFYISFWPLKMFTKSKSDCQHLIIAVSSVFYDHTQVWEKMTDVQLSIFLCVCMCTQVCMHACVCVCLPTCLPAFQRHQTPTSFIDGHFFLARVSESSHDGRKMNPMWAIWKIVYNTELECSKFIRS